MTTRRTIGMVMTVAIAFVALATLPRDADAVGVRTWTGLSDNWVFSDPTNWNGNTPIANGDLLSFEGIHEDTLRNDIPGLALTRLTFVDGFFTITGDPIQVDDIVANENGGYSTITANLSGIGRTIVGKGTTLGLSGTNTFTGQIDVAGGLVANSDKALGSTSGATRLFPGGTLEFSGRDLGLEPIIVETSAVPLTERGCSILNISGASFLRNVKTNGISCIANQAAISYPNGIQEYFGSYEIFLLSGTHIFGGAAAATGKIHIGGEGTLVWDATSLVSISNAGLGNVGAEGTVTGTGTAAGVEIDEGTFAPGEDTAPGIFTIAGPMKLQNAAFEVLLKGTVAGTGYSQAKVSGPVTLGTRDKAGRDSRIHPWGEPVVPNHRQHRHASDFGHVQRPAGRCDLRPRREELEHHVQRRHRERRGDLYRSGDPAAAAAERPPTLQARGADGGEEPLARGIVSPILSSIWS